jgi:hypothetical protein
MHKTHAALWSQICTPQNGAHRKPFPAVTPSWKLAPRPLSKREKRTAGSACETWTVAAADGVCFTHVRWEVGFLFTFETAPFFCEYPVHVIRNVMRKLTCVAVWDVVEVCQQHAVLMVRQFSLWWKRNRCHQFCCGVVWTDATGYWARIVPDLVETRHGSLFPVAAHKESTPEW